MTGYVVAPRLGPQSGQLFQGDIFASVPLLRLAHDEGVETEASLAILLTPTCDFALKQDSERRIVCAVEPLDAATPLFARAQEGKVPLHLFLLPPLDNLFAHGGVVRFRRSSPVHADKLERCARVATLDASGVRGMLAAHFRYYARTDIDPTSIHLQVDDPRRLWEVIDAAVAVPGLAERRHALHNALAVAIEAIARHHGISVTSLDAALAWLTLLTAKDALPAATRDIVHTLNGERANLIALYGVVPRDLERHRPILDDMAAALERVALLLQERDPYQITDKDLRRIGLANLLR